METRENPREGDGHHSPGWKGKEAVQDLKEAARRSEHDARAAAQDAKEGWDRDEPGRVDFSSATEAELRLADFSEGEAGGSSTAAQNCRRNLEGEGGCAPEVKSPRRTTAVLPLLSGVTPRKVRAAQSARMRLVLFESAQIASQPDQAGSKQKQGTRLRRISNPVAGAHQAQVTAAGVARSTTSGDGSVESGCQAARDVGTRQIEGRGQDRV